MFDRLPGPNTGAKEEAVAYAARDPRFAAILRLCEEKQWPEGYTDDVYADDRDFLRGNPGCDVVFVIRDLGSHVYIAGCPDECSRHWARVAIHWHSGEHKLNYSERDRVAYYYITVDGRAEKVTWQQATKIASTVPEPVEL